MIQAALQQQALRSRWDVLRDYLSLLKPRIVILLVGTAVGPMVPAAGGLPRGSVVLAVIAGGALAAGGAHAINCWLDRDIDAVMKRTRRRPIPAGYCKECEKWAFRRWSMSLSVVRI